jgi:DNA invertase Pin-like site-specific DNA recombinase
MSNKLVAYYRVSTKTQGESGLGLEAQQAAVRDFAKRTGVTIIKEYKEVESGKRADRPELDKALAFARRGQALLCVAKLDRLSRNVAFLSRLMDGGVDFVACDNPSANRLTIHILVAVAEDEAKRISDRTKAALAAYIARGAGKLGSPGNLTDEAKAKGRAMGVAALKQKAQDDYKDLLPTMLKMRREGSTLQAIADHLNAEGHQTRKGANWSKVQVLLTLRRAGTQARAD